MTLESKKTFIWVGISLAIAAFLLVLVFMPAGGTRWDAMTNRIAKLKVDAQTRKTSRSVIGGNARTGNAWEEYNIALEAPWPKDAENGGIFFEFAHGVPGVDRERVKEMVAEQASLLEHLRLGAQRSDGQFPYDWSDSAQMPSLLRSRMLANLAVAQASIHTENGKPQDAADLLLDLTVFAKDLSTNGSLLTNLIGFAVYQTAFEEFQRVISSGKLKPAQLSDLARKLEIVERDFPNLGSTLSNELLSSGTGMLQLSDGLAGDWRGRRELGGWRFMAFPRRTTVDAFEQTDAFVQRFEKLDQMGFAAAKKEADAITAEAEASNNPIVQGSMPSLARVLVVHRETLVKLRLVRAGTVVRATGEMPALADPFGANLLFKKENARWKIWSVGSDGTNHNGVGDLLQGRPDMVLEIPE